MKKTLIYLFLAASAAMAAPAPFATLDPASPSSVHLQPILGEGARISASGGHDGGVCLLFSGTDSPTTLDSSRIPASGFDGSAAAVSFWVRSDDASLRGTVAFGLTCAPGATPEAVDFTLNVPTKSTTYGRYSIYGRDFETLALTGTWHHVAFNYATNTMTYKIWFDGKLQRSIVINSDTRNPLDDFFGLPLGQKFKGAISDVKIWNEAVGPEVLLSFATPKGELAATMAEFSAVSSKCQSKPLQEWIARQQAIARSLGATCRVEDWFALQDARRDAPKILKFSMAFDAAKDASSFAAARILPLTTYPYLNEMRKQWIFPSDAEARPVLEAAAAAGEYESRTLAIYPLDEIESFSLSCNGLSGPGGASIPASAIDIKILKFWYIAPSAWNSYFAGGRECATLAHELLLHDESLIKTEPGTRKNYIKLAYPSGTRYADISEFGRTDSMELLNVYKEPVFDAKALVPSKLLPGTIKYFWITFSVPADAKSGIYSGTLDFTAGGLRTGSMKMSLEVHPFSLPKAATRYNIDKRFYGTWMGVPSLRGFFEFDKKTRSHRKMTSLADAKLRLKNIYRDFAAHNMLNPWTVTATGEKSRDLDEMQLDFMEEAGLETRPLFGDISAHDMEWCFSIPMFPPKGVTDTSVEALPELFKERLEEHARLVKEKFDRIEKRLGHREVFCSGIDEAGAWTVKREMPFFMNILKNGGKPITTSGSDTMSAFIMGGNDTPASLNRSSAMVWHEGGAEVFTYAMPFSGPINPILWRRNKGIRLYQANFDGCNEYLFCGGADIWNEFASDSSGYAPFTIAFPAYDGMIDTLQWEALREGYDDVRYITLLKRLAREAMRSGNRKLARRGRLDYAWAEALDQDCVELDPMRAECARKISALKAELGKAGINTDAFSAY